MNRLPEALQFAEIARDPRYLRNLTWGAPRPGHPEGTIAAHIRELEQNLDALPLEFEERTRWRLKILIHTHDTFKPDATPGVPIFSERSHASLARRFLREFSQDEELLSAVQLHDEPYALWKKFVARGGLDEQRFEALLRAIGDWDLFLAFLIVDGCTAGKRRDPLHWFFAQLVGHVESRVTADHIF